MFWGDRFYLKIASWNITLLLFEFYISNSNCFFQLLIVSLFCFSVQPWYIYLKFQSFLSDWHTPNYWHTTNSWHIYYFSPVIWVIINFSGAVTSNSFRTFMSKIICYFIIYTLFYFIIKPLTIYLLNRIIISVF